MTAPSTDIKRICARCGTLTYCVILRTVKPIVKYGTHVEQAEAVCPKCMEVQR